VLVNFPFSIFAFVLARNIMPNIQLVDGFQTGILPALVWVGSFEIALLSALRCEIASRLSSVIKELQKMWPISEVTERDWQAFWDRPLTVTTQWLPAAAAAAAATSSKALVIDSRWSSLPLDDVTGWWTHGWVMSVYCTWLAVRLPGGTVRRPVCLYQK